MDQNFQAFLKSDWGLEMWERGQAIFRSKKSGVQGLLDFINEHAKARGEQFSAELVVFDKIVGRAAALLAVYLKAKEVCGVVGSKSAARTLDEYKIKFYFQKTVPNILNRDKTDLCPMEKLSVDKTPEEFYSCLSKK